jgi:hypothetical protein
MRPAHTRSVRPIMNMLFTNSEHNYNNCKKYSLKDTPSSPTLYGRLVARMTTRARQLEENLTALAGLLIQLGGLKPKARGAAVRITWAAGYMARLTRLAGERRSASSCAKWLTDKHGEHYPALDIDRLRTHLSVQPLVSLLTELARLDLLPAHIAEAHVDMVKQLLSMREADAPIDGQVAL